MISVDGEVGPVTCSADLDGLNVLEMTLAVGVYDPLVDDRSTSRHVVQPVYTTSVQQRTKVCRYSWHSAGSLGWPFSKLKYKYIFRVKYTEEILWNSTRKLLRFEISKMLIALKKINLFRHLL